MMDDTTTDAQLVARVQQGEKAAFDLLVLKYQQRVMSLVLRFVHNYDDALDITQEAFIKAYRALDRFRGESAFYTWLYRIAVNTARNHISSQARKPIGSNSSTIDNIKNEQTYISEALKEHTTPEDLLSCEQVEAAIMETINALPNELRISILLREMEGMSYEEISSVMDCPIGTVRSRIFRAREMIDKQLTALFGKLF